MKKTYHGWIIYEPDIHRSMVDQFRVEYLDGRGYRRRKQMGWDQTGALAAVQWWDKRTGQAVKLEPVLKGQYRVYTEEV